MENGGTGNHPVEEPSTKQAKPIGIMAFGVLMIGWGIWFLYWFAARRPWTVYEGVERWSNASTWLPSLAVGLLCIISGLALLRLKPWSRYLVLIVTGVIVLGTVQRLIVVGPAMEGFRYLIPFGLAALFIWFFNRKSVKAQLAFPVSLKVPTILGIVVLSLQVAFWAVPWLYMGAYKVPGLQMVVYEAKPDSFYAQEYFNSPFPFRYTLAVPNGFTVWSFDQSDEGKTSVVLTRPQGGIISLSGSTAFQALKVLSLEGTFRMIGYGDAYRFERKLLSERYGLAFALLRSIASFDQVEEVKMNGLTAFLGRMHGKGATAATDYSLFLGEEGIGGGTIIGPKEEDTLSEWGVEAIIPSIKLQEKPLKSAQEFFDEGMTLLDEGDVEKAKFSFASALCLDWENADYHYHLGRAFADTENWSEARERFERTLSLKPNYAGAQDLLDQVKAKESEGEEGERG